MPVLPVAPKTLNVISEDATGCCAAIRKALKQAPDLERWNCPKCGLDWMPRMVDGMRLWEAKPVFQVWKRR